MVKLSPYHRASYLPFSSVVSARLAGSSAWDPSVVVAMALVGWRDLFRTNASFGFGNILSVDVIYPGSEVFTTSHHPIPQMEVVIIM